MDKLGKGGAGILLILIFVALGVEGLTIQKIGIGPLSIDFGSRGGSGSSPGPGTSGGGHQEQLTVPNVQGQTRQAAEQALTAADLRPEFVVVDNDAPADDVVQTVPTAGSVVASGSAVRVEISRGPFAGTWVNTDPNTRSIPQVTLDTTSSPTTMTLHVWGACSPTWCDWGTTTASLTGGALRAFYNQGFATKEIHLARQGVQLALQMHTHFTDNSGRSDYDSTVTMVRQ